MSRNLDESEMFLAKSVKIPGLATWILAAMACSVLAACGSVLSSGKPARQVYLLQTPKAASKPALPKPEATLIVSVKAAPGLDTDNIQVLSSDAQMIPVGNAHWVDNMPEVFASITRSFLSNSGDFKSVRNGSMAKKGEWLLELELQAFYGTQNSAGITDAVEVKMEGQLRCNDKRHVLHVADRASANGDSLSSLVAAHQDALDNSMKTLSSAIVNACDESQLPAPSVLSSEAGVSRGGPLVRIWSRRDRRLRRRWEGRSRGCVRQGGKQAAIVCSGQSCEPLLEIAAAQ